MFRPIVVLLAALLTCASIAAPLRAEDKGQEDLDQAVELKIKAKGLRDLNKVVELLDSAIEKGLDEGNRQFADDMLVASLMQRATSLSEAILGRPIADPRRDPRWVQVRQFALTDLQRVVGIDENVVDAQLLIGRLQSLPLGDPNAARRALTKVIDSTSDELTDEQRAQARALRGATQTDPEKQMDDFSQAIELLPGKAEYYLLRARARVQGEDFDEALADVEMAAKADPENAAAYELKGMIYRGLKKAEEAIEAFDKATELAPQAVTPYQYRGEIYSVLGDTDRAIAELSKAIELAPDNLASPLIRAELYSATEQFDLALADIEGVLRKQPGLLRGHLMRTALLTQLGRADEALATLEQLSSAAPDQPEIHLQLAGLHMSTGESNKAIDSLTRVIELADDNTTALRLRGDMYLSIGEHAQALSDFDKCYQITPEDPGLLNNLAWTLATSPYDDIRDGERAIELATKACELTEFEAAHILSTLAAAYAESGDFDKAIEWSQKALDVHAADEEKARDMTADLAAELSSYQAGEPWRELQQEDAGSAGGAGDGEETEQPAAPLLDF